MSKSKGSGGAVSKARAKTKVKKQKRLVEKAAINKTDAEHEILSDDYTPNWSEAKQQAIDTRMLIIGPMQILSAGYETCLHIKGRGTEDVESPIAKVERSLLNECAILAKDANELMEEWKTKTVPLQGKDGDVTVDDIAMFYAVHDGLIQTGINIVNVLVPRAETITSLITEAKDITTEGKEDE